MSDLYALHAARGHFKTPARATAWLLKMGLSEKLVASFPADTVEQQEWLAHYLPHHPSGVFGPPTATTAELARNVFKDLLSGVHVYKRARIIYHEIDEPYPLEVEKNIIELAQEFNSITDASILNGLQKQIVAATDNGAAARALTQAVHAGLALIRKKDAIAAQLALMTLFYDTALATQEQKHRAATTVAEATEQLLLKMLRFYQEGTFTEDCLMSDFSDAEYEALCTLVHVPVELAGVDLHALLLQYLSDAERSLFVSV